MSVKRMNMALLRLVPGFLCMAWLPSVLSAAAVQETAFTGDRTLLERFRYVRQASRDEFGNGDAPTHYSIAADGAFFETLREHAEVRLQRPDGKAEPFLFRKITHTALRPRDEQLAGRISLTQALPDGRLAVDFELTGEAEEVSGVELELAPGVADCTLEVLIGDGRQWGVVQEACRLPAAPEGEFGNVRNFPFAHPRRGRLVRLIFGGLASSFHPELLPVAAVRARKTLFDEEQNAPLLAPGTLELLSTENTGDKTIMEFHSDWTPIKNVVFDSSTPDFQRRVTIAGSNDRRHWSELAGGTIRRLGTDRALTVEIPESRWKFYRIEIANNEWKPLVSPWVRTGKVQYEFLLNAATAPELLVIYYGTNEPLAAEGEVEPPLPGASVGTYRLAAPTLNPLRRRGVTDVSNFRYLAGGLVLAGALAAIFYAMRSLRKSREELPRD